MAGVVPVIATDGLACLNAALADGIAEAFGNESANIRNDLVQAVQAKMFLNAVV